MQISRIVVRRFKAIDFIEYEPKLINVLIGENSSGKSSFLQAIQFAVSVVQAVYANPRRNKFKDDTLSSTLAFGSLDYSPAKNVTSIMHGNGSLTQSREKQVEIEFYASDVQETHACIQVRLGKNSNLSVTLIGESMCDYIASIEHNFSMYVPGLAGVPFDEPYQANGAVRRAAAKGDANTILRNILLRLQESTDGWEPFVDEINTFFPNTTISVNGHLDEDGIIEVLINSNGVEKSIETVGTGLLQTIQIAAYINYFNPDLLLLDEPDSHLHPNNQVLLGEIIEKYSDSDRSIFVATHSRHLLSALREVSKVTFFSHGETKPFENEHQILFELGALDKFDVYRDPSTRFVILVEDTKQESVDCIKMVLEASGFDEGSYIVQTYSSASQVLSARFVASCLEVLRKDLTIVVHSDRDGRTDDEIEDFVLKFESCRNTRLFITQFNDIEGYFCTKEHITEILHQHDVSEPDEKSQQIVVEATAAIRQHCLEKYLNQYLDAIREGRGVESEKRRAFFERESIRCMNGHILSGEIVRKLHQQYHLSKKDLFVVTPSLSDITLQTIVKEYTER